MDRKYLIFYSTEQQASPSWQCCDTQPPCMLVDIVVCNVYDGVQVVECEAKDDNGMTIGFPHNRVQNIISNAGIMQAKRIMFTLRFHAPPTRLS